MKRRASREINIFNLSMLDVICSALGCFLILFIIALQRQSSAEQRATESEKELERLKEDLRKARKEPSSRPSTPAKPLARAMCNITGNSVDLEISDWSAEDGDEVKLIFNEVVVVPRLALVATDKSETPTRQEPFRLTLQLQPGVNDLMFETLSNGSKGHTSARVVLKPCRKNKPEDMKVDLDVTEALYPKTKTITLAGE